MKEKKTFSKKVKTTLLSPSLTSTLWTSVKFTVFLLGRCVLKSLPFFYRQRAASTVGDKLSGEPGDSERGEVQPPGLEHHLLLYAGDLPEHQPSRVSPELLYFQPETRSIKLQFSSTMSRKLHVNVMVIAFIQSAIIFHHPCFEEKKLSHLSGELMAILGIKANVLKGFLCFSAVTGCKLQQHLIPDLPFCLFLTSVCWLGDLLDRKRKLQMASIL